MLRDAGQYEATYELCATAMEQGVDHTAIRLALARALSAMGYEKESRLVVLSALVRARRRGDISRWARTWVSTSTLADAPRA